MNRTNIGKDEKVDLVTDSNSILAGWRKHFSQLSYVVWLMKENIEQSN